MSDFSRIFNLLSEFHQNAWNNSGVISESERHPVESLRVRYWLEGLRQRTALTSSYALEQYFENELFQRSSDGKILHYPSKWSRYEQGIITPKSKTLKRVELLAPGSTRELEHPLWSVLRNMHRKSFDAERVMRDLSVDIQAVAFSLKFTGLSSYLVRKPITGLLLDKLERRSSLDSLTCLLCLLVEADEQKCPSRTEKIVRVLHNVLLMIGVELQARGVALPLLDILITDYLPLGDRANLKASMTSLDYVEASAYLNLMAYQNPQNRKKSLTWEQRVRVMHQLIHGVRGFDVEFAMRPKFEIRFGANGLPRDLVQKNNFELERRAWGWRCIRTGVSEPMPSADLLSLKHLV